MVNKFPFLLTECAGYTLELRDFVIAGIENGLGPNQASKMIRTSHTSSFSMKCAQYYAFCDKKTQRMSAAVKVEQFSRFNDPCGYYGRIPSSNMPFM
jgi:hypothetical protein